MLSSLVIFTVWDVRDAVEWYSGRFPPETGQAEDDGDCRAGVPHVPAGAGLLHECKRRCRYSGFCVVFYNEVGKSIYIS